MLQNGPFYAGKRFISVVETVSFIPAHCLLLREALCLGYTGEANPVKKKHSW